MQWASLILFALGGIASYIALYGAACLAAKAKKLAIKRGEESIARIASGLVASLAISLSLHFYIEDYRRDRHSEIALFESKCTTDNGINVLFVSNRDRREIEPRVTLAFSSILVQNQLGEPLPSTQGPITIQLSFYDFQVSIADLDKLLSSRSPDLAASLAPDKRILQFELAVHYKWPWKEEQSASEPEPVLCVSSP